MIGENWRVIEMDDGEEKEERVLGLDVGVFDMWLG